jgi:hypothetical protein
MEPNKGGMQPGKVWVCMLLHPAPDPSAWRTGALIWRREALTSDKGPQLKSGVEAVERVTPLVSQKMLTLPA